MWDGWESNYGCSRRVVADLLGYRRVFNKASVKNWGTKTASCPTLNLSKVYPGACRGVAFELPDNCREGLLAYLKQREGKQFGLRELPVRLEDGAEVTAFVPFYEGKNLMAGNGVAETAALVASARGTSGSCFAYVKGIADKLSEFGHRGSGCDRALARSEGRPRRLSAVMHD
jgi:glutathione-specific gamma-glutamylcyclotransferase